MLVSRPRQLQLILKHWSKLSSPNEPINFVKRIANEKEGLLSFLEAFIEIRKAASSPDELDSREVRSMNLEKIEEYVSVDFLIRKINNLSKKSEELSQRQEKVVNTFLKALTRREQGKPDSSDWIDEL